MFRYTCGLDPDGPFFDVRTKANASASLKSLQVSRSASLMRQPV
jgi:hypothetical protein